MNVRLSEMCVSIGIGSLRYPPKTHFSKDLSFVVECLMLECAISPEVLVKTVPKPIERF